MKKTIAVAAVLALMAVAGVAAVLVLRGSPERSACLHLADLCGTRGGSVDTLQTCMDQLERLGNMAGKEAADKGLACVDRAKSCGEAVGCVAGTGLQGIKSSLRGFFKGLGESTR
jgi:hypothetical protein